MILGIGYVITGSGEEVSLLEYCSINISYYRIIEKPNGMFEKYIWESDIH